MRIGNGTHIFVDMDETLLKGKYLGDFRASDFPEVNMAGSILTGGISARKEWNKSFDEDVAAFKEENPFSTFGSTKAIYNLFIRNLAMEKRLTKYEWNVLWFGKSDAIAIFPRPHAKEFLTELSKLGTIHICSTATRDYATAALEIVGVRDMFDGIFTREDIFYSTRSEPGWRWEGSSLPILIDDLPYCSDAMHIKKDFLGFNRKTDFSPLLIDSHTFEGWDDKDNTLMEVVLPEAKKVLQSIKDGLCLTTTNIAWTV